MAMLPNRHFGNIACIHPKNLIIVSIVSIIFFYSLSLATPSLSWEECLQFTKENNLELQAAQKAVKSAIYNIDNAQSGYWPELSVSGSVRESKDSQTSIGGTRTVSSIGPQLNWEIFSGFETVSSVKEAQAAHKLAQANLQQIQMQVLLKLRKAFSQALFTQKELALLKKIEERRKENAHLMELRFRGGLEARWSYLQAQADWQNALWEVSQTEQNSKSTLENLYFVMNKTMESNSSHELMGDFSLPEISPVEEMQRIVFNQHADILYQQQQVVMMKEKMQQQKSTFWPTLSVVGSYELVGFDEFPDKETWSAGVNLHWPLFSGFQSIALLQAVKQNYQQAKLILEQTKMRINSELTGAHNAYIAVTKKIPVVQTQLNASKERVQVIQEEYMSGLKSFLDWEQSQSMFIQSERRYLETLRDTWLALGELEFAMGKGLSTS